MQICEIKATSDINRITGVLFPIWSIVRTISANSHLICTIHLTVERAHITIANVTIYSCGSRRSADPLTSLFGPRIGQRNANGVCGRVVWSACGLRDECPYSGHPRHARVERTLNWAFRVIPPHSLRGANTQSPHVASVVATPPTARQGLFHSACLGRGSLVYPCQGPPPTHLHPVLWRKRSTYLSARRSAPVHRLKDMMS